jgi:hypothetical protein
MSNSRNPWPDVVETLGFLAFSAFLIWVLLR